MFAFDGRLNYSRLRITNRRRTKSVINTWARLAGGIFSVCRLGAFSRPKGGARGPFYNVSAGFTNSVRRSRTTTGELYRIGLQRNLELEEEKIEPEGRTSGWW